MSQKVSVDGLDDLVKALKAHGANVEDGINTVAMAGAVVLREAIEQRAPVASGRLSDNIVIGKPKIRDGNVTVPVGPNKKAWYGTYQEFGTRNHAAQPFMRPAADESQYRVLAAAKTAAKKLIEQTS